MFDILQLRKGLGKCKLITQVQLYLVKLPLSIPGVCGQSFVGRSKVVADFTIAQCELCNLFISSSAILFEYHNQQRGNELEDNNIIVQLQITKGHATIALYPNFIKQSTVTFELHLIATSPKFLIFHSCANPSTCQIRTTRSYSDDSAE